MSAATLLGLGILWLGLYVGVRRWSLSDTLSQFAPFLAELIAATGLLALATAGFFWQILLVPDTWMPAGGGDLAPFLYPNYHFAANYLRQGIIPLWNPHLYSGTPFAADIQSGLFYPVNLLIYLLVPRLTYETLEYLAIFHFWLAGATMYLCLRLLLSDRDEHPHLKSDPKPQAGLRISPLAAFAGALTFEFSDLFVVHFGNLNMIAVAAWLPLIFLLFHYSLKKSSYGFAAASGTVLAIATLAGHIQITLFILLTLGLYTLWHLRFRMLDFGISIFRTAQSASRPVSPNSQFTFSGFQPVFLLLTTLFITVGLSALVLLPAYELSQYTPRAELPYSEAAQYSLHPAQLIGLLIPNYFGRDPALHWGPWLRVETGYIGIMSLMLALIGAVLYSGRIKGFFIGLGIIALLLAMGGYTILHGWLYATMPGFDQLRAPARFVFLVDFSLAVLAAFGLNQLVQPLGDRSKQTLRTVLKPLTWGIGGLIMVAAPLAYYALLVTQDRSPTIFNRAVSATSGIATFAVFSISALVILHLIHNQWLREKFAGLAIIGLVMLDLFTLGANVDVGHANPTAGFDHPAALAFLKADPSVYRTEVTTDVWHAWQPNTALLHDLYDAWGLYNPLTLADTTLYWSGAPPRNSGRYNLLGIKYIIASKAGAPADGNIVPVFDEDPQVNIYLNQEALAPVLFVGQAVVVPNHEAAWQAIRAESFDPTTSVILEDGLPLANKPNSTLAIQRYNLDTVTIVVEADQPGYLVLSDAYYPGWRATVDGRAAAIQRANYAFRAVYVPAGQHAVQFVFDPFIWKVGLTLSGVTFLTVVGWAGWRLKKGNPPPNS